MNREQQLEQLVKQLTFLIAKNRHWKKQWDEHYGHTNRTALRLWEQKTDRLLEHLPVKQILETKRPYMAEEDFELLKELHDAKETE